MVSGEEKPHPQPLSKERGVVDRVFLKVYVYRILLHFYEMEIMCYNLLPRHVYHLLFHFYEKELCVATPCHINDTVSTLL